MARNKYDSKSPYTYPTYQKEQMYTIFAKYKNQERWVLAALCAPGNNCRDAVEKWFGESASVEKAMAFPSGSGQIVEPPTSPMWTSRSI